MYYYVLPYSMVVELGMQSPLTVVTDEVAVVVLALELSAALVGALPHWVGAPEK